MISQSPNSQQDQVIAWLLQSDPWVEYCTRIDLLHEKAELLTDLKEKIITDIRIQKLIQELLLWPGQPLSSHRSAAQLFHKLSFLADIGFTKDDPVIQKIVILVRQQPSREGLFQLKANIPEHYGGNGKDTWAWSLCDAPLVLYSLLKLGFRDANIIQGVQYILSLIKENGWPCKVSDSLGKFRGPGKKADPCPFATLAVLKMLTQFPEAQNSEAVKIGIETLLNLWDHSQTLHPYMFFMGTDFRKLKAPLFWYDILNVADVLSQLPVKISDQRLQNLLQVITLKNQDGQYTPESVYREFKDFEFGQKKQPSPWITFNVMRIKSRIKGK
ncbi:MAG: hypothetical protein WCJ58_07620 [bacterium]